MVKLEKTIVRRTSAQWVRPQVSTTPLGIETGGNTGTVLSIS